MAGAAVGVLVAVLVTVSVATAASRPIDVGVRAAAAAPTVPPVSTSAKPPACRIADKATKYPRTSQWSRTLLDWTYRLPSGYRPSDLVPVSRAGLSGGGSVRAIALADLRAMVSAARAAGARLAAQSAYRGYSTQISTFGYWVGLFGFTHAIIGSARPGHSEHQLGTALDLANRPGAYAWIARNAWRYGFVVSYPPGKRTVSCYRSEPWHVRYVGRSRAAAIHASGLVPRAWLWITLVSRSS